MASEERRNIHDELDDLLDDPDQFASNQLQPSQPLHDGNYNSAAQDGQPGKNKKKRKRNKKKKGGANDDGKSQQQQTGRRGDEIALDTTPLKYKLGASFYEDSDSSEDEGLADYKIGGYHPMHVGEILIDRYVIIQKLGWGHFSTVWLAKDIHYNTYVALKIQRSAPHYLEAAFDEVEILDQVSSYWMKPEWLQSLKKYYADQPEKLKHITGNDSYSVQLLNCLIHHGPHGKHFVMVFEILGVNLLEVIKRYNYKGAPLPLVRIMAKQCLIGLDYLHRICKIIHTDLKPENVSLCLTEKEVQEIAERGQLTTTKMYHQPDEIKQLSCAARLDPKSFRGRKNQQDDEKHQQDQQAKRAEKNKRKRQNKKKKKGLQQLNQNQESNTLQTEEDGGTLERNQEATLSPDDPHRLVQQNQKKKKKKKALDLHNKNEKQLTSQNSQSQIAMAQANSNSKKGPEFSLRNLGPDQMLELNKMLEQYIDIPKPHSLPRMKYIPSPHGELSPENEEEFKFLMSEIYKGQRYTFDTDEYEKSKQQLEEFLFYRRKFEQSQKAAFAEEGKTVNAKGINALNFQALDPRQMQKVIEEDKAKKRGPKLDENLRLKICDLGNGCWTYHHFSTEIQTRQYRSPEVIVGAQYGTSADMWSLACMIFEMATGDFLFEPKKGRTYGKDDDHLAQMMELLGRMPSILALVGKKYRKFFDRSGHLRKIRGLNYWPLKKVLVEKYRFKEREAQAFADFLVPMLNWDPEKRASAQSMLDHPWLKMPKIYETKMSDEEYQKYMERQAILREYIEDPLTGVEMSKLEEADLELNAGDLEDNNRSFFSDLEDDPEHPYFSDEEVEEDTHRNPKEYRDIAEGKNLNNSFVGPYPENWDHLHIDKGANPQFQAFNPQRKETTVLDLAKRYGLIQ